jgi:restriction endonuclease Mrr
MSQRRLPFGIFGDNVGVVGCAFLIVLGFCAAASFLLTSSTPSSPLGPLSLVACIAVSGAGLWFWMHLSDRRERELELEAQRHYQDWVVQQLREVEAQARAQKAQAQQEERELEEKVATLSALLNLDTQGFEEAIGHLLGFLGYTDVTIGGGSTGERTADIICRDGAGKKTAVRIRQYDPKTEVEYAEVLQFVDAATARGQGVEHLVFVTSSFFTDAATEAAEKFDVTSMDAVELVEAMRQFRARVEE